MNDKKTPTPPLGNDPDHSEGQTGEILHPQTQLSPSAFPPPQELGLSDQIADILTNSSGKPTNSLIQSLLSTTSTHYESDASKKESQLVILRREKEKLLIDNATLNERIRLGHQGKILSTILVTVGSLLTGFSIELPLSEMTQEAYVLAALGVIMIFAAVFTDLLRR